MTLEELIRQNGERYKAMIKRALECDDGPTFLYPVELLKKENTKTMKVSYKGATGELLKLELSRKEDVNTFPGVKTAREYAIEIADETDGHKHVFENVDLSEIKFIGVAVTMS